MNESNNKIVYTKEYSKFKCFIENRPVSKMHVKNLKTNIKEFNFLDCNPIIVRRDGDDFYVIDGQHRLEACKQLDIPVPYIETTLSHERFISMAQTQKAWSIPDRHHFYLTSKKFEYVKLQHLMDKYSVDLNTVFALLGKKKCSSVKMFKEGGFILPSSFEGFFEATKTLRSELIKQDVKNKRILRKRAFIQALFWFYTSRPLHSVSLFDKLRDLEPFKEKNSNRFLSGSSVFFERLLITRYNAHRGGSPALKHPHDDRD